MQTQRGLGKATAAKDEAPLHSPLLGAVWTDPGTPVTQAAPLSKQSHVCVCVHARREKQKNERKKE